MSRSTRRRFLKTAAAGALFSTFTIGGTKSSAKVLGANERINVGVAGINGRGGSHIGAFSGMKDVQVSYLIDPDSRLFGGRIKAVEGKGGNTPEAVQDIRTALEDKNLNAVSIATCNHWHSLIAIWACQAGKDVYVEKPCSHNVHEGRILVETAKKNKCIVQHGTQSRSSGSWANKAKDIAEGKAGKLLVSRGFCYKPRGSIGMKEVGTPPKELDFNLWLGPAPLQGYHGNLVHYNWHWFWDFGNGDIGNQGVHQMDIARWMIPGAKLPNSVISVGGRFGYTDQGQTPNTQIAVMDYGESMLVFEVRGLKTGRKVTNEVTFDTNASAKPRAVTTHEGVKSPIADRGPGDIFSNFINCVRSRRSEDLDAHIVEGHYSSALGHLANISYRLGEDLPFDSKKNAFGDNKVAAETFERMLDHLKDNNVKLTETTYRVGRMLHIDPMKEQIVNDPEANALLTRPYRQPFIVPDKVV